MARYNRWQNDSLLEAAATLDDAARRADRGAWFGSIARTLSHLLWGDITWTSRLDNGEGSLAARFPDETATVYEDWATYCPLRRKTDTRIVDWAEKVEPADLNGDLTWYSGAMKRDMSKPMSVCVMHMFNHQTHHRGQIHAMLTAAGARPGDTDIPFMPEDPA